MQSYKVITKIRLLILLFIIIYSFSFVEIPEASRSLAWECGKTYISATRLALVYLHCIILQALSIVMNWFSKAPICNTMMKEGSAFPTIGL